MSHFHAMKSNWASISCDLGVVKMRFSRNSVLASLNSVKSLVYSTIVLKDFTTSTYSSRLDSVFHLVFLLGTRYCFPGHWLDREGRHMTISSSLWSHRVTTPWSLWMHYKKPSTSHTDSLCITATFIISRLFHYLPFIFPFFTAVALAVFTLLQRSVASLHHRRHGAE